MNRFSFCPGFRRQPLRSKLFDRPTPCFLGVLLERTAEAASRDPEEGLLFLGGSLRRSWTKRRDFGGAKFAKIPLQLSRYGLLELSAATWTAEGGVRFLADLAEAGALSETRGLKSM